MNMESKNLEHPDPEQHTILIIDDEPINLQVMSDYLESVSFEVLIARDGASGLDKARYGRPDLILLDVMMPGIDGFEVCHHLKTDELLQDIPVIFLTALTNTQDKIKGFELGAVDYITKPFQAQEVLSRVKTHLALRAMQKQLKAQNVALKQEIAEREQAEEALRVSEEFHRLTLTSISDAIFLTDDTGMFKFICPNVDVIFGYSGQEVQALGNMAKLLGEEFLAPAELDAQGEIKNIERDITDKFGKAHTILVTVKRVSIRGGTRLYVCRDITERKRAEEALQQAHDELERRVEERTAELRKVNRMLKILSDCNQIVVRVTNETTLLQEICGIIVNEGGYPLVWVGFAEQDAARSVRLAAWAGYEPGYIDSIRVSWADTEQGRGPTGTAIRTGRPSIAGDIQTDPRFAPWKEEAIRRGYASSIALPLRGDDRVFGALNIYAPEPNAFNPEEVDLLMELASDLAYGIMSLRIRTEHEQAEKALRASEERYRALYRDNPSMLFTLDADGKVISVNEFGASQLGYTIEELEGLPVLKVYYEPDQPAVIEQLKTCLQHPWQVYHWQFRKVRKDGSFLWVEEFARAVIGPGDIPNVLVVCQDITERKQAEEALRASEERYRDLFQNSPISLWEDDFTEVKKYIDGLRAAGVQDLRAYFEEHPEDVVRCAQLVKVLQVNRTTVRLNEGSREEDFLEGLPPVFAAESYDTFREEILALAEGHTSFEAEIVGLTRRGKRINYHVQLSVSPGSEQSWSRVLVSGIDITERKRAEAEIQRRNRELALLNRIIAASVTETNQESILEITCRELAVAFNVPQATAILLNEQKTEVVVIAEYLAPGRPSRFGRVIPVEGIPLFQYLLSYRQPLSVDDAQNDARLAGVQDLVRQRGTVSMLIIPLLIEGKIIGSLSLEAIEPRQFLAEEVNLAESVANQVSGVLARLRLDEQRRQLEAQYYQVQKIEAIGRLTGGVAHDFNNILTAIMGYCDFILGGLGQDQPLRQDAEQIQRAAERAASLTRQLLAFSRQQVLQPQILNLNEAIVQVKKMLRRLIGEDIDLVTDLEPRLDYIKADPGQLEQVILNLAVNARDAMPEGGKLTIETANVYLDEEYTRRHRGVVAGPYVMLAVSDTGHGMDAETQTHIFEPFFTTKEQGKGTGLGLATVHGIVNQSGGHIWIYSEPGHGTTFKIYLPQIEASDQTVKPKPASKPLRQGSETILLVEDADLVRDLAYQILLGQGYTVLTAGDSQQAQQVCLEYEKPIHLLLTDVVIPGGLNGPQLARELAVLRPQMKVLYMSGYTDKAIVHKGVLGPDVAFLPKPFSPDDLSRKVRGVLDS